MPERIQICTSPCLPCQRSLEHHATAVLADEALLSLSQALLPFPQLYSGPVLDAAIDHVVHGLVVLDCVCICRHPDGFPFIIVTRSLRRANDVMNFRLLMMDVIKAGRESASANGYATP